MTYKPRHPQGPQNATQAAPWHTVGDREDVAEGVRTALGSAPQTGDPTEGRAAS